MKVTAKESYSETITYSLEIFNAKRVTEGQ
uniref:Uncharacterized protein n=1 Tax=Arundo donax TaxID=35708 RepID=A0A0A9F1V9_ARUDO